MQEIEVRGRRILLDDRGHEPIHIEAAHKFLKQDHSGTGVMVALAPPKDVVDHLTVGEEHAEPAHDLHVTLSYLGNTDEYSLRQLADLPEVLDSWAEGHKPINLAVQGAGTFLAPDEESPHVLHALVNAPGLHRVQAHLTDHLKKYGYNPRENHGYIPHITLGYTKHPVRFLPQVNRMEWRAKDVWSAIGGRRQPHRLQGRSVVPKKSGVK